MDYIYSNSVTSSSNIQNSGSNLSPEQLASFYAMMLIVMGVVLVISLITYIFSASCYYKMAKKAKLQNPWFAWVPLLNMVTLVELAQKPMWWVILMFVPLVNFVAGIMVFMGILRSFGKSGWLILVMLFAPFNLILLGYLGFSSSVQFIKRTVPVSPAL